MTNRKSMPANAKCVFKGVIFDVWQWEQKMFDGSVQTFERLKRLNTAEIVVVVGDKILVQTEEQPNTKKPFPAIPGGRCNEGEDSLVAAKRELLEETGYVSENWALWREWNPASKMDWTIFTYIARNCVLKQKPEVDAGERIQTRFVSFEDFLQLADDPLFSSPEVSNEFLRMRLDPHKKEAFRRLLFG